MAYLTIINFPSFSYNIRLTAVLLGCTRETSRAKIVGFSRRFDSHFELRHLFVHATLKENSRIGEQGIGACTWYDVVIDRRNKLMSPIFNLASVCIFSFEYPEGKKGHASQINTTYIIGYKWMYFTYTNMSEYSCFPWWISMYSCHWQIDFYY